MTHMAQPKDKPARISAIAGLTLILTLTVLGFYGLVIWFRDMTEQGNEAVIGLVIAYGFIVLAIAWRLSIDLLAVEFSRLWRDWKPYRDRFRRWFLHG